MSIPARLLAFGAALGSTIADEGGVWVARLELDGCWPIPDREVSFGKGTSCVVGEKIPVSCAEVELTLRARNAGWEGGWISTFNPDRRFPRSWREALISEAVARRLLSTEYQVVFSTSGIPDLVFTKDGAVVAAECNRLRGKHRNNDCEWRTGGDTFKPNQEKWASDAVAAGLPNEAIVHVWWNRVDKSTCP